METPAIVRGPGGMWFSGDGAWTWSGRKWRRSSKSERRAFDAGPYAIGFGEGRWLPRDWAVISRFTPAKELVSTDGPGAAWARAAAAPPGPGTPVFNLALERARNGGVLPQLAGIAVLGLVLLTVLSVMATIGLPLPAPKVGQSFAASTATDDAEMLQHSQRSVVTVRAVESGGTAVMSGSGFFVSRDGRLLTNAHVVHGAIRVSIITPDGQAHIAQKVAIDDSLDVAELATGMAVDPLALASVPALPGMPVYLLGNPGGSSPNTTTKGRVTAVHQRMQTPDGHVYPDMIMTDANSAPGNSGGPALNSKGEVVGIVTLADPRSVIGAAIPVARFQPAVAGWGVVTPSQYPKAAPDPVLGNGSGTCTASLCSALVPVTNRGGNGYVGIRIDFAINGAATVSCTASQMVASGSTATEGCSVALSPPRYSGFTFSISAQVTETTAT